MQLFESWVDFVAGWCSGAVSVVLLQPADTILTRYQVTPQIRVVMTPSSSVSALSLAKSFASTFGWTSLWRGASPMMTAVPFQNALLLGGYGIGSRYSELNDTHNKTISIFVGGTTGGLLQSFAMSPIELIKISQQCQHQSLSQATRQVLHGFRRMSSGLGATLLRDGIPHGVWFVSYDICKNNLEKLNDSNRIITPEALVPMTSGAVAATIAWLVGYPFDLIKTRIQNQAAAAAVVAVDTTRTPTQASPLGIVGTAKQLINEANGQVLVGLYKGLGWKLGRSIPASMINFTVYEFVKQKMST